jgi:glutamyl-tRNA reductase
MLHSAVNKIAHPVIHRMRRSYDAGEETEVQTWRDIFGLEDKGDG